MSSLENLSDKCKQTELDMPLMGVLPDDISLLCLARVPRRYHCVLRCVSRRWRALLSSEEWHSCRKKNNLEETWIYAMCRDSSGETCFYVCDPDPAIRSWKRLRDIPPACLKRNGMSFEASGNKLYLLGGCSQHEKFTDDVYCYDPSAEKWKEAPNMPMARCFFASAALEGKIYVTSGSLSSSGGPESWDIYDTNSNCWSSQRNTLPIPEIEKSIALDGKIYTFTKTNIHSASVYDPSSQKWDHLHIQTPVRCGPMVVVDGTLYMSDETMGGTKILMWRKETRDWFPFGRLSQQLTKPPCHLAAFGRNIFLIGQQLRTVIIDVDKAARVSGALSAFSFAPKVDSGLSVIGCKAVTI